MMYYSLKKLIFIVFIFYSLSDWASGVEPPNPFLLSNDWRTIQENERAGKSVANSPEYSQSLDDSFMWGISQSGSDINIDEIAEIGVQWYRLDAKWSEIEPTIEQKMVAPSDGNWEPLIEKYLAERSWTETDSNVNQLVTNNVQPVLAIGRGYDELLPKYNGKVANPDVLGKENYLDHIYLYARAVVRRYHDRVHYWQIEGELNEAKNTAVYYKWRSGSAWEDWSFLTRLIKVLRNAVKAEDKTAQITTTLHTDVPDWWHKLFGGKTWRKALVSWEKYMDFIGLDCYPNYMSGYPVSGEIVGLKVAQAVPLANEKKIVIMESGYPSGPDETHTKKRQSLYIQEAANSVKRNGGAGFFYFTLYSCGCNSTSKANINLIEYSSQILQNVEGYFGLVGGIKRLKKPAWHAYYDIIHLLPTEDLNSDGVVDIFDLVTESRYLHLTTLLQNYPNPFNTETWIPFQLSDDANVTISIYDIQGQLVHKIGLGKLSAGIYVSKDKAVYWNGRNNAREEAVSGVYIYHLQADNYSTNKRMLILK